MHRTIAAFEAMYVGVDEGDLPSAHDAGGVNSTVQPAVLVPQSADMERYQTPWHQCYKCPLDLWVYQELIHEVRPDVISRPAHWTVEVPIF